MKALVAKGTIELRIQDVLDVHGAEMDYLIRKENRIRMELSLQLKDVVLRLDSGQMVTIKNLLLTHLQGRMLPEYNPDDGKFHLFDVHPTMVVTNAE